MQLYLQNNYMDGSEEVTQDNWKGIHPDQPDKLDACRATGPFTFADAYEVKETAEEAYATILSKSGCSLQRDAIDLRIVEEVKNGSGTLIDNPQQVGGWPTLQGEPQKDTDLDGIPDAWEEAHGLNPRSYADHKVQSLVPGHSNLEVYLCDMVKHLY